jgi:predicted helicase
MATGTKTIKPAHRSVKAYYESLKQYAGQDVSHETAVRSAFQNLLADIAKLHGWTLIPELSHPAKTGAIRPDGTIRDDSYLPRGYWEAKDTSDDLDAEIRRKIGKGYPIVNTIFEDTRTAVLYQGKQEARRIDLSDANALASLLNDFFAYSEPDIEQFEHAVTEFKERVPELALGLTEKIRDAHKNNPRFIAAFGKFFKLCQTSLNPNISVAAVDEMLVQHLLTERLFRTIFDNEEFTQRNVIAAEVEKVITALVSRSFNRHEFLKSLDRFYVAIEEAARGLEDFTEKQHFLNTVYERFFQGYSVKLADTHGIVYTPQPIVDFMCASVAEVLKKEFGKPLGSPDVHILDPCTGTGNFIVNLLRRIPKRDLPRMYREQLFANEVMLLPYYIAALNIEHAHYELTGEYEPFEGLCFVDTLDMAEHAQSQFGFMTEENTARVQREKGAPITVIIGNPPYNVGQLNENDNNKNRKYEVVDKRIRETFAADSRATNKNALSDTYVKFFRWAIDRLGGRDGIVCFVSNNSFVDQIAFDGMRKHLAQHFTAIYHMDLHGNVRKNPKLSGTTHNVFGIQVGVGITVAVRRAAHADHAVYYHRVPETWRKEDKWNWLAERESIQGLRSADKYIGGPDAAWRRLTPDAGCTWLIPDHADQFTSFIPIGTKSAKADDAADVHTIFKLYGRGVATCRDEVVYDFDRDTLVARVRQSIEDYNAELDRWRRERKKAEEEGRKLSNENIDEFVRYDRIKWSRDLKLDLRRGNSAEFDDAKVRQCLYRPFVREWLFFDRILNEEIYVMPRIFPQAQTERENRIIVTSDLGYRADRFTGLIAEGIVDLHLCAAIDAHQCFPFYIYDEDGSNRRENITDWALGQFRERYGDAKPTASASKQSKIQNPKSKIEKWDIFYYVYGLLHHPGYRTKYADNLKRELPRIPFAPDFWAFSEAGRELSHWHLDYEQVDPYPLKYEVAKDRPLSYRVEDKMRLSKDKMSLTVNPSLTLSGIPPQAFEYRLGNRSALKWVIDQYQVKHEPKGQITSDPNRPDDPEYIVRLVGEVIRVSLETVRIVNALPQDFGG